MPVVVVFDLDDTLFNESEKGYPQWNGGYELWCSLCEKLQQKAHDFDNQIYFAIATSKYDIDDIVAEAGLRLHPYLNSPQLENLNTQCICYANNRVYADVFNERTKQFVLHSTDFKGVSSHARNGRYSSILIKRNGFFDMKRRLLEEISRRFGVPCSDIALVDDNRQVLRRATSLVQCKTVSAETICARENNTPELRTIAAKHVALELEAAVTAQLITQLANNYTLIP